MLRRSSKHQTYKAELSCVLLLTSCAPRDVYDVAPLTDDVPENYGSIKCGDQARCPEWPCPAGEACFRVSSCPEAVCLSRQLACDWECSDNEHCLVLDSFPQQPVCVQGDLNACADLTSAVSDELVQLQRCEHDSECGEPLPGWGCGCTQRWVLREGAASGRLESLLAKHRAADCGSLSQQSCNCPPARGFTCVSQRCTWNYTQ